MYYEIRSIISDHYKVQIFSRWYGKLDIPHVREAKQTPPSSFLNTDKFARRVSSTTTTTRLRISALSHIPYYNSSWPHEYAPTSCSTPSTKANYPTHSHFRVTRRQGSKLQSMRMPQHHASSPPLPSLQIQLLHVVQPRQQPRLSRVQPAQPLARSATHRKRFTTLSCINCGFSDPATGPQSNSLKTKG